MIRSLLLTLTLAGCTLQSAERSDPAEQGRFQVQDVERSDYRPVRMRNHRVIEAADPTVRQFGGQSGEPSAPPDDGFDNTPTAPATPPPPPAPAPPTPPTDDDDLTDSDNDGIPDIHDPDFNAGVDTAEPEDTGDTGDTESD